MNNYNVYEYYSNEYHPIQEYIVDLETIEKTSATPAFVLEVTWPRIVLFYHPTSEKCLEIKSKYVSLARTVRRRSVRIPVEFWALSCQGYPLACQEMNIQTVPSLLAFPGGEIVGKHIKRTPQNGLDMEAIIDLLGITLEHEHLGEEEVPEDRLFEQQQQLPAITKTGTGTKQTTQEVMEHFSQEDLNSHNSGSNNKKQLEENINAILHPHSILSDVFSDATTSFLRSLDRNIPRDPKTAAIVSFNSQQIHALREFLDLLHWTLPSRDMAGLHNLVNDLRNSIRSIIKSPEEIIRILSTHDYYNHPELQTWSFSCSKDRPDAGYACGMWQLIHVISIGVFEQHDKVMGDVDRVRVSHGIKVIRDYLTEFGFNGPGEIATQQHIQEAYDLCLSSEHCREEFKVEVPHILYFFRRRMKPLPPPTDPSWKNLSLWLWKVHNLFRINHGQPRYESLLSKEEIKWPSQNACPACYSDISPLTDGDEQPVVLSNNEHLLVDVNDGYIWNTDEVFRHLKSEYWPRVQQSSRLVVFDRHSLFRRIEEPGVVVSFMHSGSSGVLVCLALVLAVGVIVWYKRRWRVQKSGQHKKRDVYGIDDYLIETAEDRKKQKKERSTRHRNSESYTRKSSTRNHSDCNSHDKRKMAFLDD